MKKKGRGNMDWGPERKTYLEPISAFGTSEHLYITACSLYKADNYSIHLPTLSLSLACSSFSSSLSTAFSSIFLPPSSSASSSVTTTTTTRSRSWGYSGCRPLRVTFYTPRQIKVDHQRRPRYLWRFHIHIKHHQKPRSTARN